MCLGGDSQRDALVTTRDGCLLLAAPLPPPAATGSGGAEAAGGQPQVEPLADCHAGEITGVAPLPGAPGQLLSAGTDGSLRVWDAAAGGQLVGRADCPGAQLTALAACGARAVAAVGSAAGVLRLVGTGDVRRLPLLWRGRVCEGPVAAAAFSADGSLLAALCSRGSGCSSIALLSVGALVAGRPAPVKLLGYADCGTEAAALAWLPAAAGGSGRGQLLVSLASGALLRLQVSASVAAAAAEGSCGGGAAACAVMQLPLERLDAAAVALESPLASLVAGGGGGGASTAWVIGRCARTQQLRRYDLPGGAGGWPLASGAAAAPALKPAAAAATGGGGGLALSPCGRLVASSSSDGSVALLDAATLVPVGGLAPRPHSQAGGRGGALCFDASGGCLASSGGDGSLFLLSSSGDSTTAAAAEPVEAAEAAAVDDSRDDGSEPLLPALLAAEAAAADEAAGAAARAATAAALEGLRERLAGLLARNAAAPEGERLGEEEIIIDAGRLQVRGCLVSFAKKVTE